MKSTSRSVFKAPAMEKIHFGIGKSFLGTTLVGWSDKGVCAIFFNKDRSALTAELQNRFPKAELVAAKPGDQATLARVLGVIESPRTATQADLSLDIRGTAFQKRVWAALRKIPAGKTASYTEVAQKIGSPLAVRAVAGACAANALAVVIPCHRVLRQDGGLSGYRWGVDRKRALLEKEAAS